jgi:Domain of unknown function DUF29.
MSAHYEKDFYAWTLEQVEHINKCEVHKMDWDHLKEELETLSGSDKSALRKHMKNIMLHMLKVQYQPDYHTPSWDHSISAARQEINDLLDDSPSYKRLLPDMLPKAYRLARLEAPKETKKDIRDFPEECPWTLEQVLGE